LAAGNLTFDGPPRSNFRGRHGGLLLAGCECSICGFHRHIADCRRAPRTTALEWADRTVERPDPVLKRRPRWSHTRTAPHCRRMYVCEARRSALTSRIRDSSAADGTYRAGVQATRRPWLAVLAFTRGPRKPIGSAAEPPTGPQGRYFAARSASSRAAASFLPNCRSAAIAISCEALGRTWPLSQL
jgi:hypothetical protein